MPRTRDPFAHALSALRESVVSGAVAPGGPIVIIEEARRLRLSATPVREALARLAGEGLVGDAPGGGYVALRLEATDVRERYALRATFLDAALAIVRAEDGPAPPRSDPRTLDAAAPEAGPVFERLILRAANRTLADAYARLERQLAVVRAVEPEVVPDLAEEASRLAGLEREERWAALGEALADYHRRRRTLVGAVMVALDRRPARSGPPA